MDWGPFHNLPVIGCNDAYTLGDWVDVCYFGDRRWWEVHSQGDAFQNFKGMRMTCRTELLNKPFVDEVCQSYDAAFMEKDDVICWNGNTGASAIDLAWKFGASRIVLLGFDLKPGGKYGFNWHKNLTHPVLNWNNDFTKHALSKFHPQFEKIEEDRKKRVPDLEVWNANPDSALECFPKTTIAEALGMAGKEFRELAS
jgi:hypothetical protein